MPENRDIVFFQYRCQLCGELFTGGGKYVNEAVRILNDVVYPGVNHPASIHDKSIHLCNGRGHKRGIGVLVGMDS